MKSFSLKTLAAGLLMSLAMQANALVLTPGDAYTTETIWNAANDPDIFNPNAADIFTITGDTVTELYKDNAGGAEEGSFKNSYTTTYDYEPDASMAAISLDAGQLAIGNAQWLVVKDGNNAPVWYLFDISGWNGVETIYIGTQADPFWPRQGAISHITIFGGNGGTEVPAPAPLALLGLGLIGLAASRRKAA